MIFIFFKTSVARLEPELERFEVQDTPDHRRQGTFA